MPGTSTNGLPLIQATVQNGVTLTPPAGTFTNLQAADLVAVDTEMASGQSPQSVAATVWQLAAFATDLILNQATSTVHTATLNTSAGLITTEAVTTAPGSTYTFTLTNSLITTTSPVPQVQCRRGTNTGGVAQITSITVASGSCTIVITNVGTTAFNGTLGIAFHV